MRTVVNGVITDDTEQAHYVQLGYDWDGDEMLWTGGLTAACACGWGITAREEAWEAGGYWGWRPGRKRIGYRGDPSPQVMYEARMHASPELRSVRRNAGGRFSIYVAQPVTAKREWQCHAGLGNLRQSPYCSLVMPAGAIYYKAYRETPICPWCAVENFEIQIDS